MSDLHNRSGIHELVYQTRIFVDAQRSPEIIQVCALSNYRQSIEANLIVCIRRRDNYAA